MRVRKNYFRVIFILAVVGCNSDSNNFTVSNGGIIRGDFNSKEISLIFTGGDYADGGEFVASTLRQAKVPGSFFFTGDFCRNPANSKLINRLVSDGHYLAPHSDRHLLYCTWENRDSLLVTQRQFVDDLKANYRLLEDFGIDPGNAPFFIPPYEWYNDSIAAWAGEEDWILINNTPGTLSHADYTTPDMKNYRPSDAIWESIINFEKTQSDGLNGFMLLIHVGTHPDRTDKFYLRLGDLIDYLKQQSYEFRRVDRLLEGMK